VSVARVQLSARRHSLGMVAAFLHHLFPQRPLCPSNLLLPAVHPRLLFPRLSKPLRPTLPPWQLHHRSCHQLQLHPPILLLSTTPIPLLHPSHPLVRLPLRVISDAARLLPIVALKAPRPVCQSFDQETLPNSTFNNDSRVNTSVFSPHCLVIAPLQMQFLNPAAVAVPHLNKLTSLSAHTRCFRLLYWGTARSRATARHV
jgi:hypothetical protein